MQLQNWGNFHLKEIKKLNFSQPREKGRAEGKDAQSKYTNEAAKHAPRGNT